MGERGRGADYKVGIIMFVYMDEPMAGAGPMLRIEMVVSSQLWVLRILLLHSLKHIWLDWPLKPTLHSLTPAALCPSPSLSEPKA